MEHNRVKGSLARGAAVLVTTTQVALCPGTGVPGSVRLPPIAPVDSAVLGHLVDSVVTAEMLRQHVPGAVFAFVENGRVVYLKGYGVANVETARPADPARTIWRIGSISKVFTATGVVQ